MKCYHRFNITNGKSTSQHSGRSLLCHHRSAVIYSASIPFSYLTSDRTRGRSCSAQRRPCCRTPARRLRMPSAAVRATPSRWSARGPAPPSTPRWQTALAGSLGRRSPAPSKDCHRQTEIPVIIFNRFVVISFSAQHTR